MIYSVPTKVLLDTVHKDKKKWFVLKKLKYFSLCFLEKQDFLHPDNWRISSDSDLSMSS